MGLSLNFIELGINILFWEFKNLIMKKGDKIITKDGFKAVITWYNEGYDLAQIAFEDMTRRLVKLKDIKIINVETKIE